MNSLDFLLSLTLTQGDEFKAIGMHSSVFVHLCELALVLVEDKIPTFRGFVLVVDDERYVEYEFEFIDRRGEGQEK